MERLYSVPQVAARFAVTRQTVRNWIASGRLRGIQATPRGRYRIPAGALESFEREAGRSRATPVATGSLAVGGARPDVGTELIRVVSAIVAATRPDGVILFGSRARGDARPGSDVDLALVMPDGVDRRRVAKLAYEAIARVEGRTVGVEIVVLTPSIIASERDLVGSITRAIVREGVAVHGSPALA